jgi:hypothetical protein
MAETKKGKMSNKITSVLESKFGYEVVQELLEDGIIQNHKFCENPTLFAKGRDEKIKEYVFENIISDASNKEVEKNDKKNWAFDFPGWLGSIKDGKLIMIIGQEPNVQNPPIQIVYGFHQNKDDDKDSAAKRLFDDGRIAEENNEKKAGHKKLWFRVSELLKGTFGNQVEVLQECYITDICHFAPSNCGTVKTINSILANNNTQKWEDIRSKVLEKYLRKEIEALSPKIIICQSDITYRTVTKILNTIEHKEFQMKYPKKGYKIRFSKWENNITVIGVPHIGSNFNITNKFWRHHISDVKNLIMNEL